MPTDIEIIKSLSPASYEYFGNLELIAHALMKSYIVEKEFHDVYHALSVENKNKILLEVLKSANQFPRSKEIFSMALRLQEL